LVGIRWNLIEKVADGFVGEQVRRGVVHVVGEVCDHLVLGWQEAVDLVLGWQEAVAGGGKVVGGGLVMHGAELVLEVLGEEAWCVRLRLGARLLQVFEELFLLEHCGHGHGGLNCVGKVG